MKIEIKNNLYSIKTICIIIFGIMMFISFIMFSVKGFKDFIDCMILPACVGGFMLLIMLVLYLLPKTRYIFTEETLYLYNGKKYKGEIKLSNVISIKYNDLSCIFMGNLLGFSSLELTYFIDANDGIASIYNEPNKKAILYIPMSKLKSKKILNLIHRKTNC